MGSSIRAGGAIAGKTSRPTAGRRSAAASAVRRGLAAALLILATTAGAGAGDVPADLRGTRYCEIIPIYRDGLRLRLDVYNTLGQNDCPAATWDAIDAKALAKQLDALDVILNGPRFWVMDRIEAAGATAAGATKTFAGLAMTQRATLSLPARDLMMPHRPYATRTIDRETTYVFDAGKPVYEITDADGGVYVMQTFAQIVDKALTIDDLAGLGGRLKLPDGWRYGVRTLDAPLRLTAAGEATLIQDELQNSYQKRN